MLLWAVLGFLPIVVAAVSVDPATVCFPEKLQYDSYNLETDEAFLEAVDFTINRLGRSNLNGSTVEDYNTLKRYVTDSDGRCNSFDLSPDAITHRCLPAQAVHISGLDIGFGPIRIPADAWEVQYSGGTIKYAISKQSNEPVYPVLIESDDGEGTVHTMLHVNPGEKITHTDIFDIPENCTPIGIADQ